TLLSEQAARRCRLDGDHCRSHDGACSFVFRNALSCLARGTARPGRGAAVRVSEMAEQPALHLEAVKRRYRQGDAVLEILRSATLSVWPGESVALVAPSGAGKSTLLQIAGLLEQPDGGEVYIGEHNTTGLSDADRTRIRRNDIGFIYQFHHLLPEFSALENVMLPQMIYGLDKSEAKKRSSELLTFLGLGRRLEHRP